jgi:choline dehydrogenase-like flavoprotein
MNDERRAIVVGSGPSGAIAAMTLLERGIPVTMLESGTRYQPGMLLRIFGINAYRKWPAVEQVSTYGSTADGTALWRQTLSAGGLSNLWTGAVPRFAPEDFTDGERLHERYRWPLTYADLEPYYSRVERLLRVVGNPTPVAMLPPAAIAHPRRLPRAWQPVAVAARSHGHDLTLVPMADGPPWQLRRAAAAFNSFTCIVRKLQRHPHFELQLGAHALRLDWNAAARQVDAVVYVDRATGTQHRLGGAAVVLAAGPLASTKLLLNSTSADFPDGLGNSRGLLGRYLHDHAHHWYTMRLEGRLPRVGHPIYLTRAPYAESAPLLAAASTISPLSRLDRVLAHTALRTNRFGVVVFGTMVPTMDHYVARSERRHDAFGMPDLDIHISYDADVRQTIASAKARMGAIMATAGYDSSIDGDTPLSAPGASAHYGGTVRMHASPQYGLLNAWNRLHHADNVSVVDASAFTTGPEKNPTLTAMALATRAMERLAEDLRSGLQAPATRYVGCSIDS